MSALKAKVSIQCHLGAYFCMSNPAAISGFNTFLRALLCGVEEASEVDDPGSSIACRNRDKSTK